MKKIKKLVTFCLAALFTLSAGALLASCGGDDGEASSVNSSVPASSSSSSSSIDLNTPATAYRFKVVDASGNPIAGYVVQLCKSSCLFSEPTDANGEVSYAGGEGATDYDIHVFTADPSKGMGGVQVEHTGATKTPTAYSHDVITLTVTAN